MSERQDNILVQKILAGNTELFSLLVDRYKRPLINLAYHLTRNRHDAEDLAQEAFMRAFKNLAQFDQGRSFFTWLYTICLNLTINSLKKKNHSAQKMVALESQPELEQISASPWSSPLLLEGEYRLDRQRDSQLMAELLQKISTEYRTAVILRFQEELSYQEVAEVLIFPSTWLRFGSIEV